MPESFDVACQSIIGRTFRSVEELECGISPDGPALCNWRLAFGFDDSFEWMHSDVGEGGGYSCADGNISTDGSASGTYDPGTQILTWDGVDYAVSDE